MDKSPHALLSSKGADDFAIEMGIDTVPNSYFITERRLNFRRLKTGIVSHMKIHL